MLIDTLFTQTSVGPNQPPLHYPGGKRRMLDRLRPLVGTPKRLVSPFLGGGAVEVDAACRDVPVLGCDLNSDLVQFWRQVLLDSTAVAKAADKIWPRQPSDKTKDNFALVKARHAAMPDCANKAAHFLYGQAFSWGSKGLHAGPTSDKYYFNRPGLIKNLAEGYHLPSLKVKCQDWAGNPEGSSGR